MTSHISSGSSASGKDGLRGLRECIQKIKELCMNVDETMRVRCLNLHRTTECTLEVIKAYRDCMPRESLIYFVTVAAWALRDVEEDLQHWTQYNFVMKVLNKGHMNSLIESHQERLSELSHSLLDDLFDSLQKLKVLEVQIRNLKLGQDYEIVPAAETDAETEDSLRPTPEDYLPELKTSSEIWNILNKCWNTKPEGRINIEEVVVSLLVEAEMKANSWDPSASIRVPKLDGEDQMAS